MRQERPSLPPVLKRLGQHFLTDPRVLERIADALAIHPGDTVVEIGPGRGALTDLLLDRVTKRGNTTEHPESTRRTGRVIAIELDRALAQLLRERYAERSNVQIIEQDVLRVSFGDVAHGEYLLAGNVPYYITTPILFHVLETPSPARSVFLVQREVAERAVAPPGDKTYGALSVNLQAIAYVEYLFEVPPGAFSPPPKVDSAVIRVTPRANSLIEPHERQRFQRFIQSVFGLRRKQMVRVLRTVLAADAPEAEQLLRGVHVDPSARPESLSPEQFAQLFRAIRQRE